MQATKCCTRWLYSTCAQKKAEDLLQDAVPKLTVPSQCW